MSINVKNREVERLLAEIKATTCRGTSEILLELLREESRRVRRTGVIEQRRREILELVREHAARLPTDLPSPDEIIGYDQDGLPR